MSETAAYGPYRPDPASRLDWGRWHATCRIVALGGLGEVGKNMTVYECDDSIVVVDAGLAFPRDEHLGVDLVLPDFSYLRENAGAIKAVILTHGHEDHVGSLPYLMREVPIPEVWATRLTLGLVKSKLDEHGLLRAAELREVHPDDPPRELGPFRISLVRMAHSIPDAAAIVLETPAGRIVHTGDYKLDHTPVDGLKTDVGKLADARQPGRRSSARRLDQRRASRFHTVGADRRRGFPPDLPAARGPDPRRLVRVERAPHAAGGRRRRRPRPEGLHRRDARCARTRTSRGTSATWTYPKACWCVRRSWRSIPPHEQLILCTGSQGEPLSALTRIAYNDHPAIHVERGDTVIISAKPVPGNELRVHDTINQLAKTGAEVLHQEIAPVHVSGHACAEELRTLLALVRPKAVMPIHGEFRMLAAHGQLAREAGVPAANIILAENGTVVELSPRACGSSTRSRPGVTFVDGLGVGDVHDVALRDRRRLSEDGVLIVVATVAGSEDGAAGPPS